MTAWMILAALGTAFADDTPPDETEAAAPVVHRAEADLGGGWTFKSTGHLRHLVESYPDVPVDAEGSTIGQGLVLDQRLRAGMSFGSAGFEIGTEWDLMTGQVAGDTWDLGDIDERGRDEHRAWTLDGFIPRWVGIRARTPMPGFLIEAGLQPSTTWGVGMLANGGQGTTLFGRVDRGDRVLRGRVSAVPFRMKDGQVLPLSFTLGIDRVVEDELAEWKDGEEAYQVIFSVLYRDPFGRAGGVFYTFRTQNQGGDDPRPTNVHVIDGYAEGNVAVGDKGWKLRFAAEGAVIAGSTQYVLTYADRTSTEVLSGGIAGEFDATSGSGEVDVHLRAGWSSATGDPDAGTLGDFTFDRNYNVGLILFDEIMAGVEAATYNLLDDVSNSGSVPSGADLLVNEGSVRRAAYLQPAVSIRPVDYVLLRVGTVHAFATGPVAQPFYTFRAGGSPRSHLNQAPEGNYLGSEIDAHVEIEPGPDTDAWPVRPKLLLETGVALPGQPLGGGTYWLVRAGLRADW